MKITNQVPGKSIHTETFNGHVRTIYGPQGRFTVQEVGGGEGQQPEKIFCFWSMKKVHVYVSINIKLATTPRR